MASATTIFKPNPLVRVGGLLTALFGLTLGAELLAPNPLAVFAAAIPTLLLLVAGWRIATTSLSHDGDDVVVRNVLRTERIPLDHLAVLSTQDDARTSSRWGVTSRHAPTMPDDNTVRDARLLRLVDRRRPEREVSVASSVGRKPATFDAAVAELRTILRSTTPA